MKGQSNLQSKRFSYSCLEELVPPKHLLCKLHWNEGVVA